MGSTSTAARGGERISILYSFPHALGAPGIGWTAWNQVNELVRAGHDVHLVAASVARPVDGLTSVTTSLEVAGRRIPHRALGRDRALAWHDRVAARAVARIPHEVVHVWPLAATRTIEAARARGIRSYREVPNTHTAHAYEVVAAESARLGLAPRAGSSHAADPVRLATEEREWATATALLVPSDAVATTFLDRGFEPSRLRRHRYGCTPLGGVRRDDVAGAPLTAVFLGRVEPRKGLHLALDAWLASTASEHGRLLVFGVVDEPYLAVLGDRLSHPSVQLRGVTSSPIDELAGADVLLLPSIEEGSALVTYEAQAAGCVPLVSTAAGAMLEHDVHGLVHETGDVAALTAHLDLLDGDPPTLARLRRAALDHAPELTWAAAAESLIDAYRSPSDARSTNRGVSADAA
ncbi:Glycosyltransferase involved in cell wall bisynthesis [Agromyces sp. CF514]|uniref:glycosyltransferase family 4 protein n=1 Tax=Agromyces sp. CF514 TaxID=1881031 RepID=UPI0008E1426E|nr:glycosyltransferase family 4 protein [Agromyces sp. CF514]SFR72306.1 Glycosyltransferase involved in cell wall bisynthesis [Agromyces sp. CF514]